MTPIRRCLVILAFLVGFGGAAFAEPSSAGNGAATAGLAPGEIERLTALLKDEGRRAELLRTLHALAAVARAQPPKAEVSRTGPAARDAELPPAPQASPPPASPPPASPPPAKEPEPPEAAEPAPAPAPPVAPAAEPIIAPNTVGAQLLETVSERLTGITGAVFSGIRTMADLPAIFSATTHLLRDPVSQARLLDAATKLLLLLAVGVAAEWLAARVLARPRRALDAASPRGKGGWSWLRRLPLVLSRLLLDLLPIAAFGLAFYGLIGVIQPLPTTRLVGLMTAHAYMAARTAFALARMLLSPASDHLRLIPCSDAAAAYGIGWLRRLMLVGVGGFTAAEAGLFLGLPWIAYDAVLNVTLLVISLLLVWLVLQQRRTVASFLRADPLSADEAEAGISETRRLLRSGRDRLAAVWHVLVILWLIASWAVWALAIEDGFHRLLVGTALTALVLGLAKALDEGLTWTFRQLALPGGWMEGDAPGFTARVVPYLPLLKGTATVALGCGTIILLLETWGLDSLDWFNEGRLGARLLQTLVSIWLTLVLALAVWETADSAIRRWLNRTAGDTEAAARSTRLRSLLPMVRTLLGIIILVFVVLNTMSQLGVNVAPLLAGAGVIGLAIGFGSQTLVRDVITGVFLLLEDAVAVGDVVQLGGLTGVVENLSIRSIKLRATDGSVHIVPFSAVTTVTNMTRDFAFAVLDVTVAYSEDTDRVVKTLHEIGAEIRAEAKWQPLIRDNIDVWGIEKLGENGVMIRARVKTEPTQRAPVAREFNRRIKMRFDELGIIIPRPQTMMVVERTEPRPGGSSLAQAAQ